MLFCSLKLYLESYKVIFKQEPLRGLWVGCSVTIAYAFTLILSQRLQYPSSKEYSVNHIRESYSNLRYSRDIGVPGFSGEQARSRVSSSPGSIVEESGFGFWILGVLGFGFWGF